MDCTRKYELTRETVEADGTVLYRIRALRDIPSLAVEKGDMGGYVEGTDNLSQDGDCWIGGTARVYGRARVMRNAVVANNAVVRGSAVVGDNAKVVGDATVEGRAEIMSDAYVYGHAHIVGDATVCDSAIVCGNARIGGGATIRGRCSVSGSAVVTDRAGVTHDATVTDNATVCGTAYVQGHSFVGGNAVVAAPDDIIAFPMSPFDPEDTSWLTYTRRDGMWICGQWNRRIPTGELSVFAVSKRQRAFFAYLARFARKWMAVGEAGKKMRKS